MLQVHREGKGLEKERRGGFIAVVIGESQKDRWRLERRRRKVPMICRERQKKRAVKMVVQDLPRPGCVESKQAGPGWFFNPHLCFNSFLWNLLFALLLQIFMGTSCCYYTTTSEAQKLIWVLGKHGMVLWFVIALQNAICCKTVGFVSICHRVQLPCLTIASQCRTRMVKHKLLYEIVKWKADLPFCYLTCLWKTHALRMWVLSGRFLQLLYLY